MEETNGQDQAEQENKPEVKTKKSWIQRLNIFQKILLTTGAVFVSGIVWAATLPVPDVQPTDLNVQSISVPDKTETKTVEEKIAIPYGRQTVNDASLLKGSTKVTQKGSNGEKTVKYEVQTKSGVEISRKQVSETVTDQAVTQITAVGTNNPTPVVTAPNGYYMNVDGDDIPSPYHAPSAPAGASAQCGDGTYSFSAHRSGTCSHHGGVADWL